MILTDCQREALQQTQRWRDRLYELMDEAFQRAERLYRDADHPDAASEHSLLYRQFTEVHELLNHPDIRST